MVILDTSNITIHITVPAGLDFSGDGREKEPCGSLEPSLGLR